MQWVGKLAGPSRIYWRRRCCSLPAHRPSSPRNSERRRFRPPASNGARINAQPAVASAFTFLGRRRLAASDPHSKPALVQLNAVTSQIFTGIGRSPVPLLLPLDTAAFLDVDPVPRQQPQRAAACLPRGLSRRRAFPESAAHRRRPTLAAAKRSSFSPRRTAGGKVSRLHLSPGGRHCRQQRLSPRGRPR
jgi:hypothetical protein